MVWNIDVLNWSPLVALNETPKEAWSGMKLVVHYFGVFRCIAYIYIPNQNRTKLHEKREKCI